MRYRGPTIHLLLACTFWALLIAARAQPDAPDAMERYATAHAKGNVEGLRALAGELRKKGADDDQGLALLCDAVAAYREGRLSASARLLDSLFSMEHSAAVPVRSEGLKFQAQIDLSSGRYERGLEATERGLSLLGEQSAAKWRVPLLVIRAELLEAMLDLHGALESIGQAMNEARDSGYTRGLGLAHLVRGNIRFQQGRYDAALEDQRAALEMAIVSDSDVLAANASNNLAAIAIMLGKPGEAIDILEDLLGRPSNQDTRFQAQLLGSKGYVLSVMERQREALNDLRRSIAMLDTIGDDRSMARTLQHLATTLWAIGSQSDALRALHQAADHAQRAGDMRARSEIERRLYERYVELGDHKRALFHLENQERMADSLNAARFDDRLALFEVAFETERKERRLAEQEQALALAAAEERRKRMQRNLSMAIAAAFLVVAILLYRAMRIRKRAARQERELHEKQVDQLLHQQEINAINAMLEGQEKERDRLATELHDRLGSMLSTIKHQLDAVQEDVQTVRQDQGAQYHKVGRLLDEAVGEVRRISHDMVNVTLSRFGLAKALEDLCDSVRVNGRLEVELNLFGLEQRLQRSLEIAVYRMVQELVGNVLKHAKARELSISVTRGPGRLSVIVSDDGAGFDPQRVAGGIGLANVRARAAAIGGTVRVDSAPGRGTTVSVEAPVVE